MSIQHTVNELMLARHGRTAQEELTRESFERWDRGFIFSALRDQRYGQSFCDHFGITDHILYYEGRNERAIDRIRERYVR